jgi:uncharacterized protein (TIGR00297 family)
VADALGDAVATRAAIGLVIAAIIAGAALRARALTRSGAAAALVIGSVAMAAGAAWGALLIAFFVSSTALSRYRQREKDVRTGGVVAKGGERDAAQVLANGGVLAAAAVGSLLHPSPLWAAAGMGALAAAAADTWATEIGTLAHGRPRALLGWRPVPPGTSGAVSAAGTLAMIAGAGAIALLARLLGVPAAVATSVAVGGVAGAAADSLLGALVQERRWCDRCSSGTERAVHDCGAATRRVGGAAWMSNDAVNVACTMTGGAVAWAWAR